jgi:hypothetical protein
MYQPLSSRTVGSACLSRNGLARRSGSYLGFALHSAVSFLEQHAFENLEDTAKAEIIDELLNRGSRVFGDVVKNQWGAYCIQHSQSFVSVYLMLSCLYAFKSSSMGLPPIARW